MVLGAPGSVDSAADDTKAIAASALQAAQAGLTEAVDDAGLRQTFFLLTQLALASRDDDWAGKLAELGISLPPSAAGVIDLTFGFQDALDADFDRADRHSDVSEMAQRAAGEALMELAGNRTIPLFPEHGGEDLRAAIKDLSTKHGFGRLTQAFFGKFLAQYLNFHLSRVTAAYAGTPRVGGVEEITRFNQALALHCQQSAKIVQEYGAAWYSKTNFTGGITPQKTSRFMAIALNKLRRELEKQGAEP